jgi:hypothetical protein
MVSKQSTSFIRGLAVSRCYRVEMTSMSIRFSKAVAAGRKTPPPPPTRERLLVTLLHKRAAARNIGAEELEAMLRAQILWALPTFDRPEESLRNGLLLLDSAA